MLAEWLEYLATIKDFEVRHAESEIDKEIPREYVTNYRATAKILKEITDPVDKISSYKVNWNVPEEVARRITYTQVHKLDNCPFCGNEVRFHYEADLCDGCHCIHCPTCNVIVDYSDQADPHNLSDTIEELRERIVPFWNNRLNRKS